MRYASGSFVLIGWAVLGVACAAPAADSETSAQAASSAQTEEIGMEELHDFAARYAAAWSSQDPSQVAAFYAEDGVLTVNGGEPHVGREALTEHAAGFMTAFPDMVVTFDSLEREGDRVNFRWTLDGTNTGEGGTGNRVHFSGYESWILGDDGLVVDSLGNYDADEYARQLEHGVDGSETG